MKMTKTKLFIVITLAVLVIGFVLFGVLGLNNTVDYRNAYQIEITADANVQDTMETVKTVSDDYFAKAGVKAQGFAFQQTDSKLIYKFATDISSIDCGALKTEIETALNSTSNVEVFASTSQTITDNQIGWICLACGLAILASFVYILIMEKLAGAVSVIASSILSAVLFLAVMGITRIPAQPFVMASLLLSVGLTAILSSVIVNRCNEALKNVGNDKSTYVKIAEDMTNQSTFRIIVSLSVLALAAIALLAVAPVYVKFAGLQLIVAGLVAGFVSVGYTGLVWAKVRALYKGKKSRIATEKDEEV